MESGAREKCGSGVGPVLAGEVAEGACGWPIASGVIDGVARHLIADRLGITGSRRSVRGAEAIPVLRVGRLRAHRLINDLAAEEPHLKTS